MASPESSSPHVRWTLEVTDCVHDNGHEAQVHYPSDSTPVRARAASPCHPLRRSSSSSSSSSKSPASGTESPIRGRTLHLLGDHHGLISRSTVRRRAGPSSTDFDSGLIQPRSPYHLNHGALDEIELLTQNETHIAPLSSDSPSADIPQIFAHAPTFGSDATISAASTFGVSLSRDSTSSFAIDLSRFTGHRDTFALLDLRGLPLPAPFLPVPVFTCLARYVDFDTYASLRLTCRTWSAGITAACSPLLSNAQLLPAELLQQVYTELEPEDFDAARKTCRAWMMAGLRKTLLEEMCRRGGWWGSVLADRERAGAGTSEEWAMSKRLATECSLGWRWTGNGLADPGEDRKVSLAVAQSDEAGDDVGIQYGTGRSPMVQTGQTDFSELGGGYSPDASGGIALHFTVSVCTQFVLVVEGRVIYVYRLGGPGTCLAIHGGFLEPLTSIICPKQVLAVSMDTSHRRYAVAALLDDRMGLVCDISLSRLSRNDKDPSKVSIFKMEEHAVRSISAQGLGGRDVTITADLMDNHDTEDSPSYRSQRARMRISSSDSPPLPAATTADSPIHISEDVAGIHIETGPRSIYRALCSKEDPPLSVAICPQRRCVAFGCSGGIELHWVDALTGQDLNRWFPLTAPSDFLYFLPPRRGVDSAKKLRLISSAGCEGQKGGLRDRFGLATGLHDLEVELRDESPDKREGSEHFKAVPLSDGKLVLFTDPDSKMLCLGTDMPTGGPTKLERSIMFEGPPNTIPGVYAAGGDLQWGVRIVVGYGEYLWLFCVPPDILAGEKSGEWEQIYRGSGKNWEAQTRRIRGVEIGRMGGLIDVSVDSCGGCLTIWGFAADGMASTWQIDGGTRRRVKKRAVQQDGAVFDLEDKDGDAIMRDAPPLRSVDFDGSSSLSHNNRTGSTTTSCFLGNTVAMDHYVEGVHEVEMRDEDEGYWSDDEGRPSRGSYAIHVPPLDGRWSLEEIDWDWDIDYMGIGMGDGVARAMDALDILEMSRLECEIL